MIKLASALKASNVDLFNKIREALNNNQSERMVLFTPAELQRAADWYNKEEPDYPHV